MIRKLFKRIKKNFRSPRIAHLSRIQAPKVLSSKVYYPMYCYDCDHIGFLDRPGDKICPVCKSDYITVAKEND